MTPDIGNDVKCFFHSGLTAEGKVQSWSNEMAVLIRTMSGSKERIVILNPVQNLLMITIFENEAQNSTINLAAEKNSTAEVETEMSLRSKKLADLHLLKVASEKEGLANKMKSHIVDPERLRNHYASPTDFAMRRGR